MTRSTKKAITPRPRAQRANKPAPENVRVAAHDALDGLLDSGCTTFLLHGEAPGKMHSVSVPRSDSLAEGIARRVFSAWFPQTQA